MRAHVRLHNAHQCPEVLDLLHDGHISAGLVERQNLMLCAFECRDALLFAVKLSAVASNDCQQLDHILVVVDLEECVSCLDLAIKLGRALSVNEGMHTLLALGEERDSLLGFLDALLPQEYLSWVDCPPGIDCQVDGD